VLLVEDEVRMARLAQRGLTREGLAADVAETGEDACGAPKLASCLQIARFLAVRTAFLHPTGSYRLILTYLDATEGHGRQQTPQTSSKRD
jgi:hypothetical protein